jgi:hypothetical protein
MEFEIGTKVFKVVVVWQLCKEKITSNVSRKEAKNLYYH